MSTEYTVHGIKDTLIPCEPQLYDTLQRLSGIASGASVSVAINCVTDHDESTTKGWYCTVPRASPASTIAVQPNLFEGITIVETGASETQILDLIKNQDETLARMREIAQRFHPSKITHRASWENCHPERSIPLQKQSTWNVRITHENVGKYTCIDGEGASGEQNVRFTHDAPIELVPDNSVPNFVDSADWTPELAPGGFIGLYHQWYSTCNGSRELKLFFVCQSSCQKAGLEIKQLVNDLPQTFSAGELAVSEEMWWLSNVNIRNRNRLIYAFAHELGVEIPVSEDCHAYEEGTLMAEPTVHNFLHAIEIARSGDVGVSNECMPTQGITNGVICRLAPTEGVWVFNGSQRHNLSRFGGPFGTAYTVFPLTTVQLDVFTCNVARQQGYIIQQSASASRSTRDGAAHGSAFAHEGLSDSDDTGSDDGETLGSDFPGLAGDDPDHALNNIARRSWVNAKRRQLRKDREAQRAPPSSHTSDILLSGGKTMTDAYISFDDSVVWDRLKHTGWDPRYGVLRLIPLSVHTV